MKCDTNTAAHLWIGPNVNGQRNLTGFVEFFLAVSGGSRTTCYLSVLCTITFDLNQCILFLWKRI